MLRKDGLKYFVATTKSDTYMRLLYYKGLAYLHKRVLRLPGYTSPQLLSSPSKFLSLRGHSNIVWAMVFSLDGKLVVSASHEQTVRLWDAVTGKALQTLEGHSREVSAVAFLQDGKLVSKRTSVITGITDSL